MTPTMIDEYVRPVLIRYIDQYEWSFNIAKRIINRYYGTEYTEKQLKALYKQGK